MVLCWSCFLVLHKSASIDNILVLWCSFLHETDVYQCPVWCCCKYELFGGETFSLVFKGCGGKCIVPHYMWRALHGLGMSACSLKVQMSPSLINGACYLDGGAKTWKLMHIKLTLSKTIHLIFCFFLTTKQQNK